MKITCVHRFRGPQDYEMKEVHIEATEADLADDERMLPVNEQNVLVLRKAALMCLRGAVMNGRYGEEDATTWAARIIARTTTKKLNTAPGGGDSVHVGGPGADAQAGSQSA